MVILTEKKFPLNYPFNRHSAHALCRSLSQDIGERRILTDLSVEQPHLTTHLPPTPGLSGSQGLAERGQFSIKVKQTGGQLNWNDQEERC